MQHYSDAGATACSTDPQQAAAGQGCPAMHAQPPHQLLQAEPCQVSEDSTPGQGCPGPGPPQLSLAMHPAAMWPLHGTSLPGGLGAGVVLDAPANPSSEGVGTSSHGMNTCFEGVGSPAQGTTAGSSGEGGVPGAARQGRSHKQPSPADSRQAVLDRTGSESSRERASWGGAEVGATAAAEAAEAAARGMVGLAMDHQPSAHLPPAANPTSVVDAVACVKGVRNSVEDATRRGKAAATEAGGAASPHYVHTHPHARPGSIVPESGVAVAAKGRPTPSHVKQEAADAGTDDCGRGVGGEGRAPVVAKGQAPRQGCEAPGLGHRVAGLKAGAEAGLGHGAKRPLSRDSSVVSVNGAERKGGSCGGAASPAVTARAKGRAPDATGGAATKSTAQGQAGALAQGRAAQAGEGSGQGQGQGQAKHRRVEGAAAAPEAGGGGRRAGGGGGGGAAADACSPLSKATGGSRAVAAATGESAGKQLRAKPGRAHRQGLGQAEGEMRSHEHWASMLHAAQALDAAEEDAHGSNGHSDSDGAGRGSNSVDAGEEQRGSGGASGGGSAGGDGPGVAADAGTLHLSAPAYAHAQQHPYHHRHHAHAQQHLHAGSCMQWEAAGGAPHMAAAAAHGVAAPCGSAAPAFAAMPTCAASAAAAPPPGGHYDLHGDDCRSNSSSQAAPVVKKQRLVWTPELHQRFMTAVQRLGVNNAMPKSIMQVCVERCRPGVVECVGSAWVPALATLGLPPLLLLLPVQGNMQANVVGHLHLPALPAFSLLRSPLLLLMMPAADERRGHDEGERCQPPAEVPPVPQAPGGRVQQQAHTARHASAGTVLLARAALFTVGTARKSYPFCAGVQCTLVAPLPAMDVHTESTGICLPGTTLQCSALGRPNLRVCASR